MKRILLITLSCILGTFVTGFSQVTVTYGGLNNPDLPMLAGSEYMAKVDDTHLFVSSGTQGAISYLAFDPNNLSDPFTVEASWQGAIDGNTIGTPKDLHFVPTTGKLYVTQAAPAMLKVFGVNLGTGNLTFDSEISLGAMVSPERIIVTDDLILITDMTNGTVADITYNSGLSLVSIQDLGTCGNVGQYKDVELSPDGAYMYVTVFSPSSVVKFSLSPTGATCEGAIDINALLGTVLMGDLEFISADRAQVIACIGQGGVVRMDGNGDLVDPINNSMSLFDPMKSIFIPGDSLLLVQSSNTNGGTYKMESDYSLTPVANSTFMRDYNNELVPMAGGNLIRVENHHGFLGVISEQPDGSFDEVIRAYSGAFGYAEAAILTSMSLAPSETRMLTTASLDEIALFGFNSNGMPVFEQTLPSPISSTNAFVEFVDETRAIIFSGFNSVASFFEFDAVNGTTTELEAAVMTDVPLVTQWSTAFDDAGQTMLAVPTTGNTFHYIKVLSSNDIEGTFTVNLPSINASSKLSLALSPSGAKALVLAEYNCEATLIELTRTGQVWAVNNSWAVASAGISWSCDNHAITFLEDDSRIAFVGNSTIETAYVSSGLASVQSYEMTSIASGYLSQKIGYNPAMSQIMVIAAEMNGFAAQHSQVIFLEYGGTAITGELASFQDLQGNLSGLVSGNMFSVNNDGSLVHVMDLQTDIIHTFGVEDITVGVEETANDVFGVYPNPTTANVTVRFNENFIGTVTILDNTGRLVSTQSVSGIKADINLTDFNNGLYHVRSLSKDGDINTIRVVKN